MIGTRRSHAMGSRRKASRTWLNRGIKDATDMLIGALIGAVSSNWPRVYASGSLSCCALLEIYKVVDGLMCLKVYNRKAWSPVRLSITITKFGV